MILSLAFQNAFIHVWEDGVTMSLETILAISAFRVMFFIAELILFTTICTCFCSTVKSTKRVFYPFCPGNQILNYSFCFLCQLGCNISLFGSFIESSISSHNKFFKKYKLVRQDLLDYQPHKGSFLLWYLLQQSRLLHSFTYQGFSY